MEQSIDRLKVISLLIITLLFLTSCVSAVGKVETPTAPTPESSPSLEPAHDADQDKEEASVPTLQITAVPTINPLIPAPGFIVFVTHPEREVFMIDPGGGEPVHLTTLPSSASFPAISPDVTQIAYVDVQSDSTTYPILVMDVTTGDVKQIANDFAMFGGSLVWSSDGRSIAFVGNQKNHMGFPNIYIADMQDQTITQVSDNSLAEYDLAWSADGEFFAFRAQVQSGEAFTHCLFTIGRDGSNLMQLTDPSIGNAAHPAWSPDGQYLAFDVGALEDSGDIYLIAQDGSELTRLTNHPGNDRYPTWSPDGSQLAFISDREGYNAIYIMTAAGDGLLSVTNKDLPVGVPEWFGIEQ